MTPYWNAVGNDRPFVHTLFLDVPADHAQLRVLRVTAAGAAADAITDLDQLDGLRLGVDELAAALIDAAPPGSRLHLTIRVDGPTVAVEGRTDPGLRPPAISEVGDMLLATVDPGYRLENGPECCSFTLTVRAH